MTKYTQDEDTRNERKKLLDRYASVRVKLERASVGTLTVGQLMEVLHILSIERHPSSLTQHGGNGWLRYTVDKMEKLLPKAMQKKQKK